MCSLKGNTQWKKSSWCLNQARNLAFLRLSRVWLNAEYRYQNVSVFVYTVYMPAQRCIKSPYTVVPFMKEEILNFFQQISTVYRFFLQRGDGIYTVYTKMQANLGVGEIHVNCGAQRACGAGTLEFVLLWDETWCVGKSDAGKGSKPARQIYFAYRFIP